MATGVARNGADPATSSNEPWSGASWVLTMDIDGDGWKEFALLIDGKSGGGASDITQENPPNFPNVSGNPLHGGDDVLIYENDNASLSQWDQARAAADSAAAMNPARHRSTTCPRRNRCCGN